MPTHPLLQCVESPEGHAQEILTSSGGGPPEPGASMTPHSPGSEKAGGGAALCCMFCEQTFTCADQLGPHVLTQHPTTFYEPAVLRVEAEFRIPGERARAKPSGVAAPEEDAHSCIVCGQAWQDAGELEAHMRKHKDYFTFCCGVCGRRFREPWFLKTHMRMHAKAGSRGRAQQDLETPATVNGVARDPPPEPVATLYKMCMVCGFLFPDRDALAEHSKAHNREPEPGEDQGAAVTQTAFLRGLGLLPRALGPPRRSSKWIPQLDPFNTYQAWQLATRGKVAVGPNTGKDASQEASTDNEEGGSDKDESSGAWAEGPGDRAPREAPPREPRSQQQQQPAAEGPGTRRRCLMQKVKEKERPTSCEDCRRTFRTYHQLVLHSRIHKRDRSGEESPTSAEKKGRLEQAEEGSEEGLEDALSENLGPGEDGFGQTKARSRECNYCGKSFRSSYYLTIHLRTHTGEKPYKCVYCDYAAAQKTSLKYHLDRHHKDKRCTETPSRPSASPVDGKPGEDAESPAGGVARAPAPVAAACSSGASEDSCESVYDKPRDPPVQTTAERQEPTPVSARPPTAEEATRPIPANPERDGGGAGADIPLNLSLKVSFSIAPSEPRSALVPVACRLCAYESFYPEVLLMHRQLVHRDRPPRAPGAGGARQRRLTGCPPALEGRDVGPLPALSRPHPRRTKSPLRPLVNPKEKLPAAPRASPARAPVQEAQQHRRNGDGAPRLPPPPPPPPRKSFSGSKPAPERHAAPDHAPLGERSYPGRGGVIWHSDAARLCLSSQFGPLPPIDFGEPSSKRLKYAGAPRREADAGAFLPGAAGGRLLIPGRGGKSAAPPPPPESLGPPKTALGGGLDGGWGMMSLLGSYSAGDLASLYRSTPPPPAHLGLANPRAGGITVLYQHLPALPDLQRRDPAALFPHPRYGAADKTT